MTRPPVFEDGVNLYALAAVLALSTLAWVALIAAAIWLGTAH